MARKLNSQEVQLFAEAVSSEGQSVGSDAELVLHDLTQRRDEGLELTPESGEWFGDIFPGTFGSQR